MATQKILTLAEVSELLQVHPITVYRLIKQGKLPYFRIGRVLRFDADQLENWLQLKQQKAEAKNGRRKARGASSAEYLAYPRGELFRPENLLETIAISRPLLVKSYLAVKSPPRRPLVCARCRDPRKPIAALLLFASEQAKRHWKKAAMPFCRTCFGQLKKLAAADLSNETALATASKTDRRQSRRTGTTKTR
jgi:excisionase family DNA binding protein